MIAMTVNSFRVGIMDRLKEHFAGLSIVDDPVAGAGVTPGMVFELLSMTQASMLGGYCSRTHGFSIQYRVPDGDGKTSALHDMAEELYQLLQEIEVAGSIYRSTGLKHEIKDGQLRFSWEITLRMKRAEPAFATMGALEQGVGMR
ncbi:phage tail terminator family protein [Paenibacillus sp. CAU 1782]